VQHRPHFIGGQINVLGAVITQNESMTITMALDYSLYFVQQAAGLA
jgi:hypothetical protein